MVRLSNTSSSRFASLVSDIILLLLAIGLAQLSYHFGVFLTHSFVSNEGFFCDESRLLAQAIRSLVCRALVVRQAPVVDSLSTPAHQMDAVGPHSLWSLVDSGAYHLVTDRRHI